MKEIIGFVIVVAALIALIWWSDRKRKRPEQVISDGAWRKAKAGEEDWKRVFNGVEEG